MIKCFLSDILNNTVGYMVIDNIHYPLEKCRKQYYHSHFSQYACYTVKIHISRSDDIVDGIPRKYRNIERKKCCCRRRYKRKHYQWHIWFKISEYPLICLTVHLRHLPLYFRKTLRHLNDSVNYRFPGKPRIPP